MKLIKYGSINYLTILPINKVGELLLDDSLVLVHWMNLINTENTGVYFQIIDVAIDEIIFSHGLNPMENKLINFGESPLLLKSTKNTYNIQSSVDPYNFTPPPSSQLGVILQFTKEELVFL